MTSNSDLQRRALEIIQRHEAVDDAKEDLKAAYDAAESVGFTKAALRAAIKIHRMDVEKRQKHDAAQMDLELYLAEIEGKGSSEINSANTVTEATVSYLQESRRIRERSA